MRHILGISAFYHDAAAALLCEGTIAAAAQEERFSRRKNDERFPLHAIRYCLQAGRITARELDAVVFYDKPVSKFARLLETYLTLAPAGARSFLRVLPSWLSEKLPLSRTIREALSDLPSTTPILYSQHHQAHAASAFYPSPFESAAILTIDGVGEYATTTICRGHGHEITPLVELRFPHSLGLLYSAFTAYCGFRVNSGEYKLMGLAPYGEPRFAETIRDQLIDLRADGSFRLNVEHFDFLNPSRMTRSSFDRLFGGSPRAPEAALERRYLDVARSIQVVTEEVVLRLARRARELTALRNLCLAGGVALNCVANGRVLREGIFERLWIQPAAGDAGAALGAALAAWHSQASASAPRLSPANANATQDTMRGAFLGPEFTEAEIEEALRAEGAVFARLDEPNLLAQTAAWLGQGRVVGWFHGRMEFGPRALGHRSILADPRQPGMQSQLNLKIKFRESFRPFAPIVREERAAEYFDLPCESPYMLLVAPVRHARTSAPAPAPAEAGPNPPTLVFRPVDSPLPAVTHVDGSARVQTVSRERDPRTYALLEAFESATGCGVLVNTSFNVRGEPVVCTPADAYRCFVRTEMDHLVIGSYVLTRAEQPARARTPLKPQALD